MHPATVAYLALAGLAIVLAFGERLYARRNEIRILGEGGEEVAPAVFRWMAPVYILQFPACVVEHLLLHRRPAPLLGAAMAILFLLAKGLKFWAIANLRDAWTMKVILPRRFRVVSGGPYRFLRHPNYLAVIVELAALPLAGGALYTALAVAASFFPLLALRIRTEEAALLARPGYAEAMGGKRRLIPSGRR
ncbi:MAG: isoprenylcysteine carboxylmethyltransferase family protein [Candidatus Polarisedimenticolia bacterium]